VPGLLLLIIDDDMHLILGNLRTFMCRVCITCFCPLYFKQGLVIPLRYFSSWLHSTAIMRKKETVKVSLLTRRYNFACLRCIPNR